MAGEKFEYALLEWQWDDDYFRVDLPGGEKQEHEGSYPEAIELLNDLGADGWDVAGKVAVGDWVFWTMKRPVES